MPTSTRRISRANPSPRVAGGPSSGVTLIELAAVIFIIGLFLILTVPRFRDRGEVELSASAGRIQALARYLFEEAAFRGLTLRLNLDLDRQEVFVTFLDDSEEEPSFVVDQDSLASPWSLPDSVTIADVTVASAEKVTTGEVVSQFYPEGYADATIIHLEADRGDFQTVIIEPLTGKVKTYPGYAEAGEFGSEL